jgi:hypothetical protein
MRLPLKLFIMRTVIVSIYLLISQVIFAQKSNTRQQPIPSKWEASVGSGVYLDLLYANILTSDDGIPPPGYPNKKGNRANFGKMDRIEIKYLLNQKSAISLYFQEARYRDLYGSSADPLGAWIDVKRNNRRMHFTLNYYRMFSSGKKGTWSFSSGFQVQIEKLSFPFYRVNDPVNPTIITEINARPDWTYFEDWAIPLTIAHHWTVNKNLKLGLMLNTAYTMGTGIDGLAFLGNIAIPFGKTIKPYKSKK